MKTRKFLSIAFMALVFGATSFAQKTVMVGGAAMYPTKNIVENAVNSKGPFTVFAPTNAAFNKLPNGTVETLLKPENLKMLQTILTYHVVAGKMNATAIAKAIKMGKGKATLKTVSGGTLTAWMKGKKLYITDENGNSAKVTIADVNQSNGVIHVVDAVVLPKQ
jgi:uncharacterized surface protein with fasciclin (FAS1) repeats